MKSKKLIEQHNINNLGFGFPKMKAHYYCQFLNKHKNNNYNNKNKIRICKS